MAGNLHRGLHRNRDEAAPSMTTALVFCTADGDAARLAGELDAVGIHMLGAAQRGELVREAVRRAPDVVVCIDPRPDEALFAETAALQSTAPRPVIVFTGSADAACIERAVASGVHAYVVDDGEPRRLRALVQLARSRFAHERSLRDALHEVTQRYEERKWIDRAKGVLMSARRLPEDEAFALLRTASMRSNRRVGEVARQVVDAAHDAEAVNRAGQLRMLSQRAVKLVALIAAQAAPRPNRSRLEGSIARIEENLGWLESRLDRTSHGDLLDALTAPWQMMKTLLAEPVQRARIASLDALAERLLQQAERLTSSLRTQRGAASLRVIDLSGRQRMLSQRLAKQALLGVLLEDRHAVAAAGDAAVDARQAFEAALAMLQSLPLRNAEIASSLHEAAAAWRELVDALPRAPSLAGRCAIGEASETVLAVFERLTTEYERSMQVLIGSP
jgi:two-component system, response regulator PdtaR